MPVGMLLRKQKLQSTSSLITLMIQEGRETLTDDGRSGRTGTLTSSDLAIIKEQTGHTGRAGCENT